MSEVVEEWSVDGPEREYLSKLVGEGTYRLIKVAENDEGSEDIVNES